ICRGACGRPDSIRVLRRVEVERGRGGASLRAGAVVAERLDAAPVGGEGDPQRADVREIHLVAGARDAPGAEAVVAAGIIAAQLRALGVGDAQHLEVTLAGGEEEQLALAV